MSFQDCLVVERSDDWLIVVGSQTDCLGLGVPPDELVSGVKRMIKQAGLKNPSCVLAPASTSCFFSTLDAGEEIDIRDRAALTYELEDHLPIDAESIVADFVVIPSSSSEQSQRGKSVASVAIETDRWRQVAESFESAGIPVRSIVPAGVLASRSICRDLNLAELVELLLIDGPQCDVITVQSETIIAWKHANLDPGVLRRHRLLDRVGSDRVIVIGADETQQSMIQDVYGEIEVAPDSIQSHLTRGAELFLSNQSQRWFDLRRDQLGPSDPLRPIQTQLRLATLAATLCLAALVVGGWWRTHRIENEIANIHSQQQQLFQEAFPGTKVPAALLRRVRSEHARVLGSRGASSQVDVPHSAPDILRELLAALPENIRFRFKSIRILNGQVDIDLQVRSPVDAGALATSLSSAGFVVKPPVTTQKDAKTFDSVLEAEWTGRAGKSATPREISLRISIAAEVSG